MNKASNPNLSHSNLSASKTPFYTSRITQYDLNHNYANVCVLLMASSFISLFGVFRDVSAAPPHLPDLCGILVLMVDNTGSEVRTPLPIIPPFIRATFGPASKFVFA